MRRLIFVVMLGVALIVHGCGASQNNGLGGRPVAQIVSVDGVEVVSADITAFMDTVTLPLSLFAEKLEIIPLETRLEALFESGKVTISENFIGITTFNPLSFKLFDRTGAYLRDIGHQGRGPGEYLGIAAAAIDERSQTIYILPFSGVELLAFGVDGTRKESIMLAYWANRGAFMVNPDGTFSFASVPLGGAPVWAWTQDGAGNVLSEVAAPEGRQLALGMSNVMMFGNTGQFDPFLVTYGNTFNDPLYHYDTGTGEMRSLFTVRNIAQKESPFYFYTQLPGYYIGYFDTKEMVDQRGNIQASGSVHLIVDKNSLQGAYFNLVVDELGELPVKWPLESFDKGYFIDNRAAITLKMELENLLASGSVENSALLKRITDLNDSLKEDDNNVILLAKLKK